MMSLLRNPFAPPAILCHGFGYLESPKKIKLGSLSYFVQFCSLRARQFSLEVSSKSHHQCFFNDSLKAKATIFSIFSLTGPPEISHIYFPDHPWMYYLVFAVRILLPLAHHIEFYPLLDHPN